MRVLLSVPIHVAGKTTESSEFEEEARTLVVNAHGALISLATRVAAGQTVTLSNNSTRKTIECRVAYSGSVTAGKAQVGIEFVEKCPVFWQIDFPPDDWAIVPEN